MLFVVVPKPEILPAIRPGINSKPFDSSSYEFTFDDSMVKVLKPLPFSIYFQNSVWALLLVISGLDLIILEIFSLSYITESNFFRIGFRFYSIQTSTSYNHILTFLRLGAFTAFGVSSIAFEASFYME